MTGLRDIDLEAIAAATIVSLRAMRLAPRCSDCGHLLLEEGGYDRKCRLARCVRCSLELDAFRRAA